MLWLYAAYLSFQYGLRLHMNMDLPRGSATHPEYVHLVWLRKDIILMTLFLQTKEELELSIIIIRLGYSRLYFVHHRKIEIGGQASALSVKSNFCCLAQCAIQISNHFNSLCLYVVLFKSFPVERIELDRSEDLTEF